MFIRRISTAHDRNAIDAAVAALKEGRIIVYPTETAYALGCDATDPRAIRRIFHIKKRDASKPLPMIVGSYAMARRFARFDRFSKMLADRFWPGPLTLVLPVFSKMRGREKLKTAAMRVSPHPVAGELSRRLGRPVVSTSANRSGGANPYRLAGVLADLGIAPDLAIDGGNLKGERPSTIVRCSEDGCEILREGPVTAEAIRRALAKCL